MRSTYQQNWGMESDYYEKLPLNIQGYKKVNFYQQIILKLLIIYHTQEQ